MARKRGGTMYNAYATDQQGQAPAASYDEFLQRYNYAKNAAKEQQGPSFTAMQGGTGVSPSTTASSGDTRPYTGQTGPGYMQNMQIPGGTKGFDWQSIIDANKNVPQPTTESLQKMYQDAQKRSVDQYGQAEASGRYLDNRNTLGGGLLRGSDYNEKPVYYGGGGDYGLGSYTASDGTRLIRQNGRFVPMSGGNMNQRDMNQRDMGTTIASQQSAGFIGAQPPPSLSLGSPFPGQTGAQPSTTGQPMQSGVISQPSSGYGLGQAMTDAGGAGGFGGLGQTAAGIAGAMQGVGAQAPQSQQQSLPPDPMAAWLQQYNAARAGNGQGASGWNPQSGAAPDQSTMTPDMGTGAQAPTDQSSPPPPQGLADIMGGLWGPQDQAQYNATSQQNMNALNAIGAPKMANVSIANGMISGGGLSLPAQQMPNLQAPPDSTPQIQAAYQQAGGVLDNMMKLVGDKDQTAKDELEFEFRSQGMTLDRMVARAQEEYTRLGGQLDDTSAAHIQDIKEHLGKAVSQAGIAKATTATAYEQASKAIDTAFDTNMMNLKGELARQGIANSSQAVVEENKTLSNYLGGKRTLEGERAAQVSAAERDLTDVTYGAGKEIARSYQELDRAKGQIGAAYQDRLAQIEQNQMLLPEQKRIAMEKLRDQTNGLLLQIGQKKADLVIGAQEAIGKEKQTGFANKVTLANMQNGITEANQNAALKIMQVGYGMQKDAADMAIAKIKASQDLAQNKQEFALKFAQAMAGNNIALASLGVKQENAKTAAGKAAVAADQGQQKIDITKAHNAATESLGLKKLDQTQIKNGTSIDAQTKMFADGLFQAGPKRPVDIVNAIISRSGGGNTVKAQNIRNQLADYVNQTYYGGTQVIPSMSGMSSAAAGLQWWNSLTEPERIAYGDLGIASKGQFAGTSFDSTPAPTA